MQNNQQLPFKERFIKKLKTKKVQRDLWGYLFVAPAIIAFILFVLIPIILSMVFSFTDYNGINVETFNFVGVKNYRFTFETDTEFWNGMKNIGIYTIIVVPVTISLSMLLAVIIKKEIRGTKFFRGAFYIPGITSVVATAAVWSYLLSGSGVINKMILGFNDTFGTNFDIVLVSSSKTALTALIIMAIWGGLGGNMVLFLAGMKNINPSLYEAAEMDGAGPVRKFFSITLPLMKPSITFALTLALIGAPQMFEPILIMDARTTSPVMEIYSKGVAGTRAGLASAQAMILFVIIMIITFVMQAFTREKD